MPTQTDFSPGDWVQVKVEYDIPALLRNNQPTKGRIEDVFDDPMPSAGEAYVGLLVPISDADVDEHSQYVPYPMDALEKIEEPNARTD